MKESVNRGVDKNSINGRISRAEKMKLVAKEIGIEYIDFRRWATHKYKSPSTHRKVLFGILMNMPIEDLRERISDVSGMIVEKNHKRCINTDEESYVK